MQKRLGAAENKGFRTVCGGYIDFSGKELVKVIFPFYRLGTAFTSSYLVFFLFIPYLNLLLKGMDEKKHIVLVVLCLTVNTIMPTFLGTPKAFTYIGWFMVLYFIASYIQLYPKKIFSNRKFWSFATMLSLILSWVSILAGAYIYARFERKAYFYFVADSNKFMALITAVCAFLLFKNLNLKYNPFINTIASSTFGVLLIHANSDTMRQWLWKDTLKNTTAFYSDHLVVHAVGSVLIIYCVCTLIDLVRIKFLEKPFFSWYDKHFVKK